MSNVEMKIPVEIKTSGKGKCRLGWWKCECGHARPIEPVDPETNSDPIFAERTCSVCGCSINMAFDFVNMDVPVVDKDAYFKFDK